MAPQSVTRGALRSRDRAVAGMLRPRQSAVGAQASRYGVASSFGRHCSALRGRTIRVVAFRASHPVKPSSRQRRLVQGFLKPDYLRRWIVNPRGIRYNTTMPGLGKGILQREQVAEELIAYLKAMSAAKRDPLKQNDRPGLERLSPGG